MEIALLLRNLTPISHNHPELNTDSNLIVFRRIRKLTPLPPANETPEDEWKRLCQQFSENFPIPADLADILENEPAFNLSYFVALLLIVKFLDIYNPQGHVGLLKDANRYDLLRSRCQDAAVRSLSLLEFWGRLGESMFVPLPPYSDSQDLFPFWTLPCFCQKQALRFLDERCRDLVTLARFWYSFRRQRTQNSAPPPTSPTLVSMLFPEVFAQNEPHPPRQISPEILQRKPALTAFFHYVPEISASAFRHYLREAGYYHLCQHLELHQSETPLPTFLEYFFRNGGALRAGSKAPQNVFALRSTIRSAYPLVDLFGGNLLSFDMRTSALCLSAHLLCQENQDQVPHHLKPWLQQWPHWDMPYTHFLEHVTHYRGNNRLQETDTLMPFGFETLTPNSLFLLRLVLRPFTADLTVSALAAVLHTAFENPALAIVGGRAAMGYGWVEQVAVHLYPDTIPFDPAPYENYLQQNKTQLRAALLNGTLMTNQVLVTPEPHRKEEFDEKIEY